MKTMLMITILSRSLCLHMMVSSHQYLTRQCGQKQHMVSSCILHSSSLLLVEERKIGAREQLKEEGAAKARKVDMSAQSAMSMGITSTLAKMVIRQILLQWRQTGDLTIQNSTLLICCAAMVKKTDAKDGMKKRGAHVHISPSSPAMGTRSKVQTSPSSPAMGTRSKKRLNLA